MNLNLILRNIFSMAEIIAYTIAVIYLSGGVKREIHSMFIISIFSSFGLVFLVPFVGIFGYMPIMIVFIKCSTDIKIINLINGTIVATFIMFISNVVGAIFSILLNIDLKIFNPILAGLVILLAISMYYIVIKEKINVFSMVNRKQRKENN